MVLLPLLHALSFSLVWALVLVWPLSSNMHSANYFYLALLLFCQAAPGYPIAVGVLELVPEGRTKFSFWKAALSENKLSRQGNCKFRCLNQINMDAKSRKLSTWKIKALWGHVTAHQLYTAATATRVRGGHWKKAKIHTFSKRHIFQRNWKTLSSSWLHLWPKNGHS